MSIIKYGWNIYPFPNFNGAAEVWKWLKYDYLSMLGLKWIRNSNEGPWDIFTPIVLRKESLQNTAVTSHNCHGVSNHQHEFYANNNENTNAPYCWTFMRGIIRSQTASSAQRASMSRRHHDHGVWNSRVLSSGFLSATHWRNCNIHVPVW